MPRSRKYHCFLLLLFSLNRTTSPKGRDTRCDKSLRHVASIGCCNKSPRVTCENHCRCDLSHEFKLVWIRATYRSDKISASSLVAPCVRICDKSLRQNWNQPMKEHQLVSRHVKFELVYISSLQKSIACTEQVSYRSDLSQHQCRRGDLLPRCVASCVSALRVWTNEKCLATKHHQTLLGDQTC